MLIACGNDSHNNQIRVTKSGMVYRSMFIPVAMELASLCLGDKRESHTAGADRIG